MSTRAPSSQDSQSVFHPHPSYLSGGHVPSLADYRKLHAHSLADPSAFWGEIGRELHWFKPWDQVLDASSAPFYKWYTGGLTNLCYNALDRHLSTPLADKVALFWEGEPGDRRTYTFRELHEAVCRMALALKALGGQRGDRVALYMPMIPELMIAVLAVARIGAIHTVIFGGFSSLSIQDRVNDSKAKLIITADFGYRRGKPLPIKAVVDEAVTQCPSIEHVLVVSREAGKPQCPMQAPRDVAYEEISAGLSGLIACEPLDAEDVAFLLYTSGTTGKPKGIVHSVGGYGVYTYLTTRFVFDVRPSDIYWCTADIGWITGHSYVVYGPLMNGLSQVMYEGSLDTPDYGRTWDIIERYGVTTFYTAPTAVRSFMKWGDQWPAARQLGSIRLMGSVGEPINPEAWHWLHHQVGKGVAPIVDTWWQTETGGHMITPLPAATPTKAGSATLPFLGIDAVVLDEEGNLAEEGTLAIRRPWPGMLRGIWGDEDRYKETYWSKWSGQYYLPGDSARIDADGYIWILGRIDDIVNVSGHRIGTAELESALIEHPSVAESAVVGIPHSIKGQGLVAFVTFKHGYSASDEVLAEMIGVVDRHIGKFARPERIVIVDDLPKTRSGKIMRRLLRDILEGRPLGNTTTLADPTVVDKIQHACIQ
ncbi:MAG TPA: acetate--CoA ligase [Opitutales bacterium]|nr:acetate--CoA ligase [Opitutales bacterium]